MNRKLRWVDARRRRGERGGRGLTHTGVPTHTGARRHVRVYRASGSRPTRRILIIMKGETLFVGQELNCGITGADNKDRKRISVRWSLRRRSEMSRFRSQGVPLRTLFWIFCVNFWYSYQGNMGTMGAHYTRCFGISSQTDWYWQRFDQLADEISAMDLKTGIIWRRHESVLLLLHRMLEAK